MSGNLTEPQERFAALLARGTGLELPTVRTWVLAEGGPADNPLNIMQWTSGQRSIRRFGTPEQAAQATVTLLRNERYAGILSAARGADVAGELASIAVSPWEENRYRGKTGRPGALLDGAHARLYPSSADRVAVSDAALTVAAQPVVDLTPGFDLPGFPDLNPLNALEDIAKWSLKNTGKAFLHMALTALALVLIFAGLNRSLNGVPAHVARAAVARGRGGRLPATDDIPF